MRHIKTSVLKFSTTMSGHSLTGVVTVDHSDEKRAQMGQKSSSLRNPGMWHINRSVLRCCWRLKYKNLTTIVNVDHSDEKRVQMGQKPSSLRNVGMWHITRLFYDALQGSMTHFLLQLPMLTIVTKKGASTSQNLATQEPRRLACRWDPNLFGSH